jgi:hypothetical protein
MTKKYSVNEWPIKPYLIRLNLFKPEIKIVCFNITIFALSLIAEKRV